MLSKEWGPYNVEIGGEQPSDIVLININDNLRTCFGCFYRVFNLKALLLN